MSSMSSSLSCFRTNLLFPAGYHFQDGRGVTSQQVERQQEEDKGDDQAKQINHEDGEIAIGAYPYE